MEMARHEAEALAICLNRLSRLASVCDGWCWQTCAFGERNDEQKTRTKD